MKTLLLQFNNNEDYELIFEFAKRLGAKILPPEDFEFSEELKNELDERISEYDKNPNETYSIEDVKSELEMKIGRKISTT